ALGQPKIEVAEHFRAGPVTQSNAIEFDDRCQNRSLPLARLANARAFLFTLCTPSRKRAIARHDPDLPQLRNAICGEGWRNSAPGTPGALRLVQAQLASGSRRNHARARARSGGQRA